MKTGLIICMSGMSSSIIAKKASDYFDANDIDIHIDATTVAKGPEYIKEDNYDLYLVSPQAKMRYKSLALLAEEQNKPIINIPPQDYVPIPTSTAKLADLIQENI